MVRVMSTGDILIVAWWCSTLLICMWYAWRYRKLLRESTGAATESAILLSAMHAIISLFMRTLGQMDCSRCGATIDFSDPDVDLKKVCSFIGSLDGSGNPDLKGPVKPICLACDAALIKENYREVADFPKRFVADEQRQWTEDDL